ncbi:MAG: transposase [Actinobacteria bacterium]|nr:transposase [Actinomycetota bacterium]
MFECKLVASNTQTAFGPLCLLGHYLSQEGVLEPLSGVHIVQKSIKHSPQQKLLDVLMGILSGCKALYEIDVRVRPDAPLQRAFGRERVADQSTIQRTLNAFSKENVSQLRGAVEAIGRRYSAVFSHDFEREMLLVEVDLTGLRASKRAEGSTKGYFSGERNATGRQLLRVIAPQYKEILFEKLYAGNTTSCEVLKQSIREVERILNLAEDRQKRRRTLVRLDGGFGTDANLNWLMWRGYEFIAKGYGGKRAKKLASSVAEDGWEEGPTKSQKLGVPASPHRYARRSKTVVRRWVDEKGKPYQDYLVCSLFWLGSSQIAKLYDARGGMETDIKGDKRGLGIENRRKKSFLAQEALVLLAQLSHNLIVYFKRWFLRGTAAAKLGVERLVREVLAMVAEVRVGRMSGKVSLKLPHHHPWAKAVAAGIETHRPRNGWRTIWRQI